MHHIQILMDKVGAFFLTSSDLKIFQVTPLSSASKEYSATCYIPSQNFGNHTLHEKPDNQNNEIDRHEDDDLHENPYFLAVLWIILLFIGV